MLTDLACSISWAWDFTTILRLNQSRGDHAAGVDSGRIFAEDGGKTESFNFYGSWIIPVINFKVFTDRLSWNNMLALFLCLNRDNENSEKVSQDEGKCSPVATMGLWWAQPPK